MGGNIVRKPEGEHSYPSSSDKHDTVQAAVTNKNERAEQQGLVRKPEGEHKALRTPEGGNGGHDQPVPDR